MQRVCKNFLLIGIADIGLASLIIALHQFGVLSITKPDSPWGYSVGLLIFLGVGALIISGLIKGYLIWHKKKYGF